MSQSPELDQVADARRQLARHALLPWWSWAVYVVFAVVLAGLPVWESYLSPQALTYAAWTPTVLALAVVVVERVRRARSGVHLPRSMGAYPSVWKVWLPMIVITAAGYVAILLLVNHGHRGVAIVVVPVVAALIIVLTLLVRRRMSADIEAGRVRA